MLKTLHFFPLKEAGGRRTIRAKADWLEQETATLAEIERRVLASSRQGLQLLPAQLGNQAGMIGAAKLAWELGLEQSS